MARYLTAEEEHDLAIRWREQRDEAAMHQIIESHMRLATSAAMRFRNFGLPLSDLIQEANIGLLRAARDYDPDRGARFSTFAMWWIKATLREYVFRNWALVRGSLATGNITAFFQGDRPKQVVPLDAPINEGQTLADVLPAEELDVDGLIDRDRHIARLRACLHTLDEREALVVRERYLQGDATFQAIGDRIGLSKERIRQIETKALEKLRSAMEVA